MRENAKSLKALCERVDACDAHTHILTNVRVPDNNKKIMIVL